MKVWRFYACGVSGIVMAGSQEQAADRAKQYLITKFGDINFVNEILVWAMIDDDDYCDECPWALAVSY